MRHKEGSMEDKLKAAIMAYAETQSKVLDRVFDNIRRTGSPSSADLAFCLPDDVIAGLPQDKQYAAFLRKVQFLGYAMWKSACYRQVREHTAFETERTQLIERFPSLERRFQRGIREGYSTPAPVIGAGAPPDDIAATVTENGCTLLLLPSSPGCNETGTAGEPSGRRS
jgi:hypothetical protein